VKPRETFRAEDRIRKRSEYQRVYDRGRKVTSRSFTLFLLENDLRRPRLGITVTRRVGPAVRRNRAKRLVREWFRKAKANLPGVDLLVHARMGLDRMTLSALSRELDDRVRQAGGVRAR
jgi:ribonuclease P protein component